MPPFHTKNYADSAISYLWFEASKALRRIEEIIIIGYSLPTTDFAPEALLRVALSNKKRNNIPVTIVNTDSTGCQKVFRDFQ